MLGGRFQIKQFVGVRGLGERYRAVEVKRARSVDLQLLPAELGQKPAAIAVLEKHIQQATQLAHKNIAACYGMGQDGGSRYIAAEFVEGQTLADLIAYKRSQGKPFTLKGTYNVIAHLCNGLAYAHQTMHHGGLSLTNILVNPAGRVKMTDFGIGHTLCELPRFAEQQRAGLYYGMAPELLQAPERTDRRADIYSVGVVLFELLTGEPPGSIVIPSQVRDGVPKALDQVVAKCLSFATDERYLSAEELKQALVLAVEQAGIPQVAPVRGVSLSAGSRQPSGPVAQAVAPGVTAPTPTPVSQPAANASRPNPNPVPASNPLPWANAPSLTPSTRIEAPPYSGPTIDETLEIWLIQKNKLDFGPYTMAEVKRQILRGEIEADHGILNNDSGEQSTVGQHPYLSHFVTDAIIKREERRRLEADRQLERKEKRRSVAMIAVFLGLAGVTVAGVLLWMHKHQAPSVVVVEKKVVDSELEQILKGLSFEMPKATIRSRKPGKGGKHGPIPDDFDEPTRLGDASQEGGDEQLTPEQIQSSMNARGKPLALCIAEERRRNPGIHDIDLEFIVHGSGQVSAVRVNGQKGTPIATCMLQKMRAIPFPHYSGPKTVAGFSWKLK
jgi:serine/threonine-protein kinase